MDSDDYQRWMALAFREAELAAEEQEVPVGAVVIQHGRVIGRGHNRTIALHDATAHAEMIALTAAFEYVGDWRLEDCLLVSTLEPCAMCAGAAVLARIKTIVYGARDVRFGGCATLFTIPTDSRLNHRCELVGGIGGEQSAALLRSFFQQVRQSRD